MEVNIGKSYFSKIGRVGLNNPAYSPDNYDISYKSRSLRCFSVNCVVKGFKVIIASDYQIS